MAIRIPTISNEVQPETAKIPNPADYSVAPPKLAFGEFQSTQDIGNTISNIGVDLNRYQQRKLEEERNLEFSRLSTQHKININDLLNNNDDEEIDINGERIIRKKGMTRRRGKFAIGATKEFTDKYNEMVSNQLSGVQDKVLKQRLIEQYSSDFPVYQNKVVQHEYDEDFQYKKDTHNAVIQNAISSAVNVQGIDDFEIIVRDALTANEALSNLQGIPEEMREVREKEVFGSILGASLLGNIIDTDKTGVTSRNILKEFKPSLSIEDYNKIDKAIDVRVKENAANLEEEISDSIIDNGATIDNMQMIMNNEELLGSKKVKRLVGDIEKIQNSKKSSLSNEFDFSEEHNNLVASTESTIAAFVDSPLARFRANEFIINLMKEGLDQEEAKQIKALNDRILQRPEERTMWQGLFEKSKSFMKEIGASDAEASQQVLELTQSSQPEDDLDEMLRIEYNKQFPERPILKGEKVIDPNREKEFVYRSAWDQLKRKSKSFGFGLGASVESLGQGLISGGKTKNIGWFSPSLLVKVDGKTVSEHIGEAISKQGKLMTDFYKIDDPTFSDKFMQAAGSSALFYVPGLGVAGAARVAMLAPRMAAWFGATTMGVLEALTEGGSVYSQAIKRGHSEKSAADLASATYWTNLSFLVASSRVGMFSDMGPKVFQVVSTGLINGGEEVMQGMISSIALSDPLFKNWLEEFTIGTMVGSGSKITTQATDVLNGLDDGKKLVDDLKKRTENVRGLGEVISSERGSVINPSNQENLPEDLKPSDNIVRDESGEPVDVNQQELSQIPQEGTQISEDFGEQSKKIDAKTTEEYVESIFNKKLNDNDIKKIINEQTGQTNNSRKLLNHLKDKYDVQIKSLALTDKIGEKLSQKLEPSKTKNIVRESTGQSINEDKVYTERKALRISLQKQARSAAVASSQTKKDLTSVKKNVVGIIKQSLPLSEQGKYLNMVATASNNKDVVKAIMRLDKNVESLQRKELISNIKNVVKDASDNKSISIDYTDKIKGLVEDIDLVKRSDKTVSRLNKLQDFINSQVEEGKDVEIPRKIINKLKNIYKKPVDLVETEELEELSNDINMLVEMGRLKLKTRESIDSLRKQNDLSNLKQTSKKIESLKSDRNIPGEKSSSIDKIVKEYKVKRNDIKFFGLNISPRDVAFDMIDGNKNYQGANYRIFKKRYDYGYNSYLEMRDNFQKDVKLLASNLNLNKKDFELIGIYAAKEQEGGEQKLLDSGFTKRQINSVKLNDNQMKLYTLMRSKLDEMRPLIENVMKNVYNQPVGKVKNYFSFMTDFSAMSDSEIRDMFEDNVVQFGDKNRQNVEKGFTIDRVLGKQAIKVNAMDVFMNHIDNASYLVNLGGDIKYLGELAATEDYRKAVGDIAQEYVREWVDLVARKGKSPERSIKIIDNLRSNVGAATLGLKLSSVLIQPTALMDGAGLIGTYAFNGFKDVVVSKDLREFVINNFPEIRARIGDDPSFIDYDKFDSLANIKRIGYKPLQSLDGLTASGVALGAYKKYLDDNNIEFDINKPNKEAIREAQLIVRRTQSTGLFKDVPAIFTRGDALTGNVSLNKAILQFQSFMFNRWSLMRHDMVNLGFLGGDVKKGLNVAFFLALANFAEIGIRHISKELVDLISDGKFDEDERENPINRQFALNIIQSVPFLGQATSILEYNSNPVPMISATQKAIDSYSSYKKSKRKTTKDKNRMRVIVNLAGLLGVPGSGQADQIIREKAKTKKSSSGKPGTSTRF